jgi:hypothetical protein
MHKIGRCAGAGKSCRNLVGNMAGFAHAHHNDPALAGKDQLACLDEIIIYT